ncbi:hypothetical protein GCM10008904_32820 [Paraclostridium ghonii]|uniref:LPXTG cell wall anchor domain-containing protein n=1 Tax=Paraclostridium ghonii TaxID=29358 RepID=A0ABU0N4E3_9FIRM|nr:hypothetical protein [Paeniclostridium ghonii]
MTLILIVGILIYFAYKKRARKHNGLEDEQIIEVGYKEID